MRYTLDENGYLNTVFFGCMGENCRGWEGEIPDDLEENLGAYHFGNGWNLTHDIGFKQGCILDDEGNEVEGKEYNWAVTDYIDIYNSRKYAYKNATGSNIYGAYYDEEYNFIDSFLLEASNSEIELTIPEGAKYVKFTIDLNNGFYHKPLTLGTNLSGKELYCENLDLIKEDELMQIISTDTGYSLMAGYMNEVKTIWINDADLNTTVIYREGDIDNLPYTLPSDFGNVSATEFSMIYPAETLTKSPNYYLFTHIESSTNDFNLYSTNELILDEAKLEEIQNDIVYDYSTKEVFTGRYWINGEPIYRKVVPVNFSTSDVVSETPHGILNIKCIIIQKLIWFDTTDGAWYEHNKDAGINAYFVRLDNVNQTNIVIRQNAYNWQKRTEDRYVILEYTKETD